MKASVFENIDQRMARYEVAKAFKELKAEKISKIYSVATVYLGLRGYVCGQWTMVIQNV